MRGFSSKTAQQYVNKSCWNYYFNHVRKAGLEVLSIRRTRKEEVLLVLKKGGDVSAFRKELDLAVGERAQISALVSTRSLEIRDLDETVEKEEVVSACAWHWADRLLRGPAGSSPALVG